MEITLQAIREVLRDTLGRDSFVASFIKSVQTDDTCPTASINAHGALRYNPKFVEKYVTSPTDLFCLIAHELMHPMFGHFVYRNGELENIGADMVINAVVSLLFAGRSGNGSLFKKFYKPICLEGLLRPESQMRQSRYARLYDAFYNSHAGTVSLAERSSAQGRPASPSTGEVIQALKVLTPSAEIPVIVLLGGHGKAGPDASELSKANEDVSVPVLSAETVARIAEDLKRAAKLPNSHCAGFGEALYNFFIEVLKTHLSLKRVLLERFTTRQKIDRFRKLISRPRIGVSPIPIQPSKRDFVMLAAGVPPFHYHNQAYRQSTQDRGLAVYLDVSGSVNQHLPEIIGLLRNLRTDLKTVFLFSNKVVEVPFRTLLAGQVQTSHGTDFDCIAEHIIASSLDKAVILTDGYASMNEENQEQLKKRSFVALTILFGGRNECPEFAPFGDTVQLEDITE